MNTKIETFLQEFHKKHPGCTPAAFSNGFTNDGLTSYDLMMSVLPLQDGEATAVVDLGCGDGVLLQRIAHSGSKKLNLVGVDMSSGELDAARSRLGSTQIKLLEAKAQSRV